MLVCGSGQIPPPADPTVALRHRVHQRRVLLRRGDRVDLGVVFIPLGRQGPGRLNHGDLLGGQGRPPLQCVMDLVSHGATSSVPSKDIVIICAALHLCGKAGRYDADIHRPALVVHSVTVYHSQHIFLMNKLSSTLPSRYLPLYIAQSKADLRK